MAGRITLTKSILNTLPFYAMQVIYLPRNLCDKLDKVCRDFIWGDSEETRRVHMINWEEVCKPKTIGGLGLRSARKANDALITKLGWRFLAQPEALWSQVLAAKYVKNHGQGCIITKHYNQSAIWSGLTKIVPILENGLKWTIGDGRTVRFWEDNWILGEASFVNQGISVQPEHTGKSVANYWVPNLGWNWESLEDIIPREMFPKLESVFLDDSGSSSDTISWRHTSNSEFSTKSVYNELIQQSHGQHPWAWAWKEIWKLKVPEKLRLFLWFCTKGRIMTNKERWRRKFTANPYCSLCRNKPETIIHLLRDCPRSSYVWRSIIPREGQSKFFRMQVKDWLSTNIKFHAKVQSQVEWRTIFATTCWWIWRWRNDEVFHRGQIQDNKAEFIFNQVKDFEAAWNNNIHGAAIPKNVRNERSLHGAAIPKNVRNERSRWCAPPQGWLKLNTDETSKGNPGRAGGGGVIRDADGKWMGGFIQVTGFCDALTSEAWAIRRGLQLAISMGVSRLIVECESQSMVRYMTEGIEKENTLSTLVDSCKDLICHIVQVEIRFCYRECNRLADHLANLGLEF